MSDSFVTLWTVTWQASLSMGFPRQANWSGLPFPSAGDLPKPWIKPSSPVSQVDHLPLSHLGNHYKKWNIAICSNMDVPRDYHTKWSNSEEEKYHMTSLIHGISKKIIQMKLFTKQKQVHRHGKQRVWLPKQESSVDKLRVWDEHLHTTI